jgi:hypothetical protein
MMLPMSDNPYAPPSEAAELDDPREQQERKLARLQREVVVLGSVIGAGGLMYAGWLPAAIQPWDGSSFDAGLVALNLLGTVLRLAAAVLLWRLRPLGRQLHLMAVIITAAVYLLSAVYLVGALVLCVGLIIAAELGRARVRPAFEAGERLWSLRDAGLWFWLLHAFLVLSLVIVHYRTFL